MSNIIIYPTGSTTNTDPNIIFDDGTTKLSFDMNASGATNSYLNLSSSTNPDAIRLYDTGTIETSGASVSSGSVYVGGNLMIDSTGVWVGPTTNIKGAQGAQGAQGSQGAVGATGGQGTVGAQGSQGAQGTGPQDAAHPKRHRSPPRGLCHSNAWGMGKTLGRSRDPTCACPRGTPVALQ